MTTESRRRESTFVRSGALALLEKHGKRKTDPDYSQCDTAEEVRWVKLGGELDIYRGMLSQDDAESERAYGRFYRSLSLSGTAYTRLSMRSEREERRETGISEEIAARLRGLGINPAYATCENEEDARKVSGR